ncbi:hypothetical protein F4802DRAFT_602493 [Xylaria palmicola]|nr:hypothetical protein F4802DRAFT_602493 [Xylaria palmicola]
MVDEVAWNKTRERFRESEAQRLKQEGVCITESDRRPEVLGKVPDIVAQDFAQFPFLVFPDALFKTAGACVDAVGNDIADEDSRGWLALHKQRHQRAIAPYLAAAAVAKQPPGPEDVLVKADTAASGTTLDHGDRVSDRDSNSVPASTRDAAEVEDTGDVADSPAGIDDGHAAKAPFRERYCKVLNKKRSFWKKKE